MPNLTGSLIKKIKTLPPMKSTLQEVLDVLRRDSSDWTMVARKVSQDPVLSGRVLQLANSSFYGYSRNVKDVESACMLMGTNTVRNLVFSLVAMAQMREGHKNSLINYSVLWQHNLRSACLMQAFAKQLNVDATTAFTAGLFHSLGVIVEDFFFPELALLDQHADRQHPQAYQMTETRQLEYCVALLGYWRFPADIIDVFVPEHNVPPSRLYALMRLCCSACDVECQLHQRQWRHTLCWQNEGVTLGLQQEDIQQGVRVGEALFHELAPVVLA